MCCVVDLQIRIGSLNMRALSARAGVKGMDSNRWIILTLSDLVKRLGIGEGSMECLIPLSEKLCVCDLFSCFLLYSASLEPSFSFLTVRN